MAATSGETWALQNPAYRPADAYRFPAWHGRGRPEWGRETTLLARFRRFLPVTRTYAGEGGTPYLTRTTWGRARLHVFHRGDSDPDPHDHPWAFWTFPLTSYVEEVTERAGDAWTVRRGVVRALRAHHRPATHLHRVLGRWSGTGEEVLETGRIYTLVLSSGGDRAWGFLKARDGVRCWTPWADYILRGGKHAPCAPEGDVR
jgi:hypothetical protein